MMGMNLTSRIAPNASPDRLPATGAELLEPAQTDSAPIEAAPVDPSPSGPALVEPVPSDADPGRMPPMDSAADDLPAPNPGLAELRRLLLDDERVRAADLGGRIEKLESAWEPAVLAESLGPALGPSIRRQLDGERELVVESLVPMVGDLVRRAVVDAIQELAQQIDGQVRRSLDLRLIGYRVRARLGGAAGRDTSLRLALPFKAHEVLLIHQQTGILLRRLLNGKETILAPGGDADPEMISGMLTAIRDFAGHAMAVRPDEELSEIQVGPQHIYRAGGTHCYVAVIATGEPPIGYRHLMREAVLDIERRYRQAFKAYDGQRNAFEGVDTYLRPLALEGPVIPMTVGERFSLRVALALLAGLALWAAWHLGWLDALTRLSPWARKLPQQSPLSWPFE